MLPGFRFLFAAIILCVSILVFGLGAAALLRAAHEEFASKPSWRGAPEATFTQHLETTSPVLAFVRLEPRPAVELKPAEPAAAVAAVPVVAAPQVTAPAVVARIEPAAAVEPPAQAGETTAALRAPEASPGEPQPGTPSPLPAGIQADAPKPAASTETARSDVPPEIKADTRPQMPQDWSPAPIAPPPSATASTADIAPAQPAEAMIATAEDAKPKATEPKTTEPKPTEPKASDEAARVAAEPPPAVTASANAPTAAADAPAPSANMSAPAANAAQAGDAAAPQTGDTAAKVATTGDPTVTLEPQSSAPAIGTRASMVPGRHAMQKQPRPQRTREQQQRRRLALRARVARQQPAAIAAQQQYAFPIQPQQPPQTFTPVQRPPSF